MKRYTNSLGIFVLIFLFVEAAAGQSQGINRWEPSFQLLDRINILGQADTTYDLSISDINVKDATTIVSKAWQNPALSNVERRQLSHFLKDNYQFLPLQDATINDRKQDLELFKSSYDQPELVVQQPSRSSLEKRPILKYFYKDPANFLRINSPQFDLYINPIVVVGFGKQVNNTNKIFQNTRGIEVKAYIDSKIYIYTQLLENQRSFFNYLDERIVKFNSVPGQGKWKGYLSSLIGNTSGFDFFTANAVIGFRPTKSLNIEFGHGNHFIGHGYRSLLLSDYAANRLYLSLDWQLGRFKYRNIYSELGSTTYNFSGNDEILPKKFNVTHFLSFKASDHLELGIFETVTFAREKQFELNYLNPVILYRAVEFNLGSPDNVMVGADIQWKIVKGLALYGQILVDEFYLKEVTSSLGWWANKFGGQLGVKYYNAFGIKDLDLRLETNAVRPYTYAHRDTIPVGRPYSVSSYAHANLPLAHPLGANFRELIGQMSYRPIPKLLCQGMLLHTVVGLDQNGQNWGSDILLDVNRREQEYNNVIGQGLKTTINEASLRCSYEVFHNYFLDVYAAYRTSSSLGLVTNNHYLGGGIRINIANKPIDY
jgi:hypothetical protein